MANDTIFQFADKFGIESPFGNWLKDNKQDVEKTTIISINAYLDINLIRFNGGKIIPKEIEVYDHKKRKRVKKSVEVGYYEDNLRNRIIPIFLIIEVAGFPLKIEIEQAGKTSSPQKFGTKSYRLSTSIPFYSNSRKYQDINFNVSLFLQGDKKTDAQTFSIRVFHDGYLSNSDMKIEEEFANELEIKRFNKICGNKYANQIKCTRYRYSTTSPYIYGPVYKGKQNLREYKHWNSLIKKEVVTEEQKEIFVAMSENEGNLDSV